ncbi:MAG TPA: TetR/AcrR family transcriptional regulator [Acidimicrobiales bacterium]|nr:TetR/AcrR family transcriptional regulator [Acidimicrobiales bacterium]
MEERLSKRQERAAATADQLLHAAREVFEEKGYQATTVGAITEAANCAHGTFYLHFRNKEDAFGKVMADVIHLLYEEARGGPWDGDPYPALYQAHLGYLRLFSQHARLMRCIHEGMHRSKAVEEMWLALRRPFIDRIQRVLTRLADAGTVRSMNTLLAAHALGSMTEWTAFTHFVLNEPPVTETSLEELATALTDLWWHSVVITPVPEAAHQPD